MPNHNAIDNLIVGGDSLIGRQLHRRLVAMGADVVVTSRRVDRHGGSVLPLELREPSHELFDRPIGVAWLCAAQTSLEACHLDPEGTRLVNVEGTIGLAQRLLDAGTFVVFISTNMVFDGDRPFVSAHEARSPQTAYGRQKAIVEEFLESRREQAAIVRLTKVLAPGDRRFREWRRVLAAGGEVRAFGDLPFSPVPLALAAQILEKIGASRQVGVWQLSGADELTYREAALRIALLAGADAAQVIQSSADSLGYYEQLPRHATLDASRALDAFQLSPAPAWPTILEALSVEGDR